VKNLTLLIKFLNTLNRIYFLKRKKVLINPLYGGDVTIEDIIATAKRYPMMAERQVVIVKEAQDLSKTIDKIENYAENPMPSTVLVFCYKYKTLDKRKKVTKTLAKTVCFLKVKNFMKIKLDNGLPEF